jgi:PIN domain nuclease of toxin-antitoxin system
VRLLLDTHVALWSLSSPSRLGKRARAMIQSGDNDVFVSAVTVAEIAIKTSLGKLRVPADVVELFWTTGFVELPLSAAHAERLGTLPWLHQDPFDRMLVAQAQHERLTLVTADGQCADYEVGTADARR